jgi:hypothetical protein
MLRVLVGDPICGLQRDRDFFIRGFCRSDMLELAINRPGKIHRGGPRSLQMRRG